VHAVATGAVGRHHRASLRGQAVVAVQITGHAVAGHAELLSKPYALVAAGATVARQALIGDEVAGPPGAPLGALMCGCPWQSCKPRQRVAARDGLAVDALGVFRLHAGVAAAAGGRVR